MSHPNPYCQARMKNLRQILWGGPRRPRNEIVEQLELNLPGSRLSRDELQGLEALRRLRRQLAATSPR